MKKRFKILAIIALVIIVCGFVIKSQMRLVKLNNRTTPHYSIYVDCNLMQFQTIEDIAVYAKKKTAADLSFSWHNDIVNGKANCVGYAQYAAVICNELFKRNNIKAKAKPVVGCYYFRNTNIHNLITKFIDNQQINNFIKDHDYVEIVDSESNVVYSFDPSIYDLTWLDFEE